MKLRNVLLVVSDIEKSVAFYKELFGLEVLLDQGETVILSEGLVLQEKKIWEDAIQKRCISKNHMAELYFEETDMDAFIQKLENYKEEIEYITPVTTYDWGKKIVRFYDLDGNMIEVGGEEK